MKKAVVAIALILALLITATSGTVFVNLAKALPPEIEYKTPPIILVHSPVNNDTFSVNSVLLNFTVTKPDYWLTHGGYAAQQILKSINYQLDEKYYDQIRVNSTLASPFDYSVNLTNLTDGLHSLKVHAYASGWVIQMNGFYEYEVPINSSSDIVYFTVDSSPTPTPSPTNTMASPTPTVPEFPSWTISLLLTLTLSFTGLWVYKKKQPTRKTA